MPFQHLYRNEATGLRLSKFGHASSLQQKDDWFIAQTGRPIIFALDDLCVYIHPRTLKASAAGFSETFNYRRQLW